MYDGKYYQSLAAVCRSRRIRNWWSIPDLAVATGRQPFVIALLGVIALFLYSFIQTAQEFTFGRAFAAYGGIFIVVAVLWGWLVDGHMPEAGDWAGVIFCLIGVSIILLSHRS